MGNNDLTFGDRMLEKANEKINEETRAYIWQEQQKIQPNRKCLLIRTVSKHIASLNHINLEITESDLGSNSGQIEKITSADKSYRITINALENNQRKRFTVAHELAHLLLHRDDIGDGITEDALLRSTLSNPQEAEANSLAAAILMPRYLVEFIQDSTHERAAEVFARLCGVSEIAAKIRLSCYEKAF